MWLRYPMRCTGKNWFFSLPVGDSCRQLLLFSTGILSSLSPNLTCAATDFMSSYVHQSVLLCLEHAASLESSSLLRIFLPSFHLNPWGKGLMKTWCWGLRTLCTLPSCGSLWYFTSTVRKSFSDGWTKRRSVGPAACHWESAVFL